MQNNFISITDLSKEEIAGLIGTAEGTICASTSEEEEIECGWYDRSQVRRLLATAPFESRTQLYCHLWAKGGLK